MIPFKHHMRSPAALSPLALLLLLVATPVTAAPVLFPSTPEGPAEVRDERDVAPYLAAWKRSAFSRSQALATAATPNQLAYATWVTPGICLTSSA